MSNMRQILKRGQPSLRMAEGGMFDSLKRAVGMAPPETITQRYARQDAEFRAKHPQAAPAPVPVTQNTPAPMGSQNVLDKRMAAAGLRDGGDLRTGQGGHVPGTGHGDKIPAKYEPGEFVVSNDMLDAQPELQGHLTALRENVLAQKGMTPAQADAKALNGGKGLRAEFSADGSSEEFLRKLSPDGDIPFEDNLYDKNVKGFAPGATNPAPPNWTTSAGATGPGPAAPEPNFTTTGAPRAEQPGFGTTKPVIPEISPIPASQGPMKGVPLAERQASWNTPQGPSLRSDGFAGKVDDITAKMNARAAASAASTEARIARTKDAGRAVGDYAKAQVTRVTEPVAQTRRLVNGVGSAIDTAITPIKPALRIGGAGLGAYGAYSDGQAAVEKFQNGDNIGGVDSALSAGASGLSMLAGSAGALGTAGALGSAYVGGHMIGSGVNYGLDHMGDTGIAIKDSIGSAVNKGVKALGFQGVDTTAKDLLDKYGGDFNKIPPAELAALNKYLTQRDSGGNGGGSGNGGGTPAPAAGPTPADYHNSLVASTADSDAYNAAQGRTTGGTAAAGAEPTTGKVLRDGNSFSGSNISGLARNVMPGVSKEVLDRNLTNPDGSRWSENDNAIMAANLRDGADKYAGTSRAGSAGPAVFGVGASPFRGSNIRNARQQAEMDNMIRTDGTTRRGQDITESGNIRSNTTTVRGQNMTADTARSRLAWEEGWKQYEAGQSAEKQNFDIKNGSDKALHDEITAMIPAGADGKPDTQTSARYALGLNAMKGNRVAQLQQHLKLHPNDANAAAELNGINKQGANVIPADMKRKYIAGMQVRDIINSTATGGLTPWGTKAVHSDAPVTSMRKNSAGEYVVDEGNGKTTVIPARYIDKVGGTLGFGGQQNANFDILKAQ